VIPGFEPDLNARAQPVQLRSGTGGHRNNSRAPAGAVVRVKTGGSGAKPRSAGPSGGGGGGGNRSGNAPRSAANHRSGGRGR
jgi:ATP-dependent RNA helicase RhlE